MAIKVGINGFGRIGRMVFRAATKDFPEIEVVAINDLLEPDYLAYMLKYDSVHGRFQGDVSVSGHNLVVNGKTIRLTAEKDPANLKWNEVGADIVIECTGFFLDDASCQKHIAAGAKKVVMSAPCKDATPMFVYGVNHESYAGQSIISNASSLVVHASLASTRTGLVGATSRNAAKFARSSGTPTLSLSTGYFSAARTFLRITSGLAMPILKEVT